jgi:acyl dehydratase
MYEEQSLKAIVGQTMGASGWHKIDQAMINQFADLTSDHQFIHIDEARARETPFGGTVAHGFLSLSMLSAVYPDCAPVIDGVDMTVNYGFNKVRFLSPVRSGSRVRAHLTLKSVEEKPGVLDTIFDASVEIEGNDKPALVAEWIIRHFMKETA